MKKFLIRDYAVAPGTQVTDQWNILHNKDQTTDYLFRIYGPNGFFREFGGNKQDPDIDIQCEYGRKRWNNKKLTGNIVLHIKNLALERDYTIDIVDNAYKAKPITKLLNRRSDTIIHLDLKRSFSWYDFTINVRDNKNYSARYAGHVETGENSFSDPAMGKIEM